MDDKPIWLGGKAPYTDRTSIVEEARELFFRAVHEFCPEALRHLRDVVFPVYRDWLAQAGLPSDDPTPHTFGLLERSAPAVASAIATWAERFHLAGKLEPLASGPPPEDEGKLDGGCFGESSERTAQGDAGTGHDGSEGPDTPEDRETVEGPFDVITEGYSEIARMRAVWPCQWAVSVLYFWADSKRGREMLAQGPAWASPTAALAGVRARTRTAGRGRIQR